VITAKLRTEGRKARPCRMAGTAQQAMQREAEAVHGGSSVQVVATEPTRPRGLRGVEARGPTPLAGSTPWRPCGRLHQAQPPGGPAARAVRGGTTKAQP